MPLIELIYYSSSIRPLTEQDVALILKGAREKNQQMGVSGMLVFSSGYFLQVLEGPRDAVNAVFQSISHDPRHYDVCLISVTEVQETRYHDWIMGYLTNQDLAAIGDGHVMTNGRFNPANLSQEEAHRFIDQASERLRDR